MTNKDGNKPLDPKFSVAVLEATGAFGQRFVQLLEGHPWFQQVAVTGSVWACKVRLVHGTLQGTASGSDLTVKSLWVEREA